MLMTALGSNVSLDTPIQRALHTGLNVFLLLFTATILVVDRVYGLFALAMLVTASTMLIKDKEPRVALLADEKLFLLGLCSYPAVVGLGMLLHLEWEWDQFDHPSRFLLVIPVFFAVRRYGISRKLFFIGCILGAVGAGSFGFYEKYILGQAIANGHIHKIQFGDISLMLGVLSLVLCIKPEPNAPRNNWVVLLAVIGFLFGLTGSICSGTRGGWIAVPFMLWFIFSQAIDKKAIRYSLYAIFIAACMVLYQSNDLIQDKVDRAVNDTSAYLSGDNIRGSAGTRFEMWRAAGMMFSQSPLTGVGMGNYQDAINQLIDQGQIHSVVRGHGHAHNEYLHLAAELGLLGLLGALGLYGLLIRFFIKHRAIDTQISAAGILLLFGFIDFGLTQALLKHSISTVFLALLSAVLAGMLCHQRLQAPARPSQS